MHLRLRRRARRARAAGPAALCQLEKGANRQPHGDEERKHPQQKSRLTDRGVSLDRCGGILDRDGNVRSRLRPSVLHSSKCSSGPRISKGPVLAVLAALITAALAAPEGRAVTPSAGEGCRIAGVAQDAGRPSLECRGAGALTARGVIDADGEAAKDSRLLIQVAMLLGMVYVAFLTAWFWATRLRPGRSSEGQVRWPGA
jgi:hypothetical protein